ncbi:transcriptional regulator [Acinetobacter sp. LoGeW2-3]|uniref:aminotransferase-like domain-containing protein n=1 Tax=Acinetobacter sp. LoGeW2-3 TaxID=1808001 RepID=UPI000C05C006|nr:PLP-dependent aminotransferase family protein [Acinetobacter sp. LoGeW2-3]ATO20451.1 transcriptional regulator [Acinetobacter sp. LoGeW2-3]
MYKFEKLARSIHQMIEDGIWKAHDKLPSLREQSELSGYSLMTVLNAYQELEAQGWLYAKDKSGYYIAERADLEINSNKEILPAQEKIQINSVVFNYLKDTQAHDIVPLGSAFPNPELLFNNKFMQLLSQHAKRKNSYLNHPNMPPGNLELRQIIAGRYQLQGISCHSDDIVITSGALDALNLSLQALTQPGDFILLQETVFYGAWQAAERLGLNVVTLPDDPESGFDLDAFEKALKQYPIKVCWLMLNAQNPIGYTVSAIIKKKIAQLLFQYQVHLIEDDVYQELNFGKEKPVSVKHFDQHNMVLHCGSFSKTLGMGARVGWVFAGSYSNAIQHVQLMSTLTVSPLLQNALVDFVAHHHYEKHLRSLRRHLDQNKKRFYQELKGRLPEDCQIHYFPTGYFLWVELPESMDSQQLYIDLLEQKISIAPSLLFRPKHTAQNFIRLNCSFEWTDELATTLDQIIYQIKKNKKA